MRIIEKHWNWNGELRQRNSTNYIVIHHAKASNCTAEDIHRWHQENDWLGIGYHFFIGKDGTITRGRPEMSEGAHTLGFNDKSIGICLEGNLETEIETAQQVDALVELLKWLKITHKDAMIVKHSNLNKTLCPANLDFTSIVERVEGEGEHWAEKHYQSLKRKGVAIHERRFDDKITRGEVFAILDRLTDKVI